MSMRNLSFCLFLLAGSVSALGQHIESYVNADGVKVFTTALSRRPLPAPDASIRTSAPTDKAAGFRPLIRDVSARYGLDQALIEAIIRVESDFEPRAVSVKDCKGLMQLHPDTAKRFGVENVFDPGENVEGGVRYLRFLLEEFEDDLSLALAAYNAGENAVRKYQGIPPYRETRDYVKKIAKLYDFSFWSEFRREQEQPLNRVFRISLPDGGLLLTNTPGSHPDSDH